MTAGVSGRIGPNAIIQMGEALAARHEDQRARRIFGRAGLLPYLDQPPVAMVHQGEVARLFAAVADEPDTAAARDLFADAGRRTGPLHPRQPHPGNSAPHSPQIAAQTGNEDSPAGDQPPCMDLRRNRPGQLLREFTRQHHHCREPIATPLGCVWHAAVFETIFGALIRGHVQVRETCCHAGADHCCSFEIT